MPAYILGLDIRYVVTSLTAGSAEHIYDTLYCARGQAENLIKMHKGQLASLRAGTIACAGDNFPLLLAAEFQPNTDGKRHAYRQGGICTGMRVPSRAFRCSPSLSACGGPTSFEYRGW